MARILATSASLQSPPSETSTTTYQRGWGQSGCGGQRGTSGQHPWSPPPTISTCPRKTQREAGTRGVSEVLRLTSEYVGRDPCQQMQYVLQRVHQIRSVKLQKTRMGCPINKLLYDLHWVRWMGALVQSSAVSLSNRRHKLSTSLDWKTN